MTPCGDAPLILTAMLDEESQAWFEAARRRHFPPALNFIPAHVTLFHHLPGHEQPAVAHRLVQTCLQHRTSPFTTTGLRFLGRGSAYVLDMATLAPVRRELAAAWDPWLTNQDRQAWRPHVTVQNKVAAAEAKRVHAALQAGFAPRTGQVTGLALWCYLGGPWELLERYHFAA